jgi:hypothetical protein
MKDKRVLLASGISLLTFRLAPSKLRQYYGFDYNGLDSESPNILRHLVDIALTFSRVGSGCLEIPPNSKEGKEVAS